MVQNDIETPSEPPTPQSSTTQAVAQGIFSSKVASSKQALMGLVDDLRSTGVALDVDLPTIVVAGNQSSGKSSLIEAISGIKLPRANGTCTRVPIEVRLKQKLEAPWQCRVKIRREVNEAGEEQGNDQKPEVDFGLILTDPDEVESTIRRAQLAILNPSVLSHRFETYDLPEKEEKLPLESKQQLAFSRNVVVLEITGPNVTDLTLVDLPGIIKSVGPGEDKNNISLVENLVRTYISKECLILLVITMSDDIQNQGAAMLASEVDPSHSRTIGVLTKADLVKTRKEMDGWLEVIKNKTLPLLHGYHVTRQPDADELAAGLSFDVARANEATFFHQGPWTELDHQLQKRLGTDKLIVFLSDQLLKFIREKLPAVLANINSKYDSVRRDLLALGKGPSDDPSSEMLSLVNGFIARLDADLMGSRGREVFMQSVNAEYRKYKEEVCATAPRFTPFAAEEGGMDDDECIALHLEISRIAGETSDINKSSYKQEVEAMNLDDVRDRIHKSLTRELPHNVPFAAKVQLIRGFTVNWAIIADDLLARIKPMMEALLEQSIDKEFGKYHAGMLPARIHGTVTKQLENLSLSAQASINKLIALEERPFTLDDEYLDEITEKMLACYRDERYPKRDNADETYEKTVKEVLAGLAKIGYTGTKQADLAKLLNVDEYETELKTMAEIRAYWHVAYKRIIDNVPRFIDAELIVPAAAEIQKALLTDLKILTSDGQQRCRALLEESEDVRRRRAELEDRKARLIEAKEAVRKVRDQ